MLLSIDIGNTHVDLGLFRDEELLLTRKLPTGDPADALLQALLAPYGKRLEGAAIGSVVADLGANYAEACRPYCAGPALEVQGSWDLGLEIDYDDPNRVGIDRLVAAAYAHAATPKGHAAIVVDAGTALTVDAIDAEGTFLGGAIAPGLRLGVDALSANTSFLPRIDLEGTVQLMGKDTVACLRSGAIYGSAALVEGLCRRMSADLAERGSTVELDAPVSIFLTGGDSSLLHPLIEGTVVLDPAMVLRGLHLAYKRRTS
jgi:type III pantothenate kinase